jgi:hypothetical protein
MKSKLPESVLALFRAAGRVGGKKAAANMTKAARSERAKAAGKASGRARRSERRVAKR